MTSPQRPALYQTYIFLRADLRHVGSTCGQAQTADESFQVDNNFRGNSEEPRSVFHVGPYLLIKSGL